MKLTLLCVSAVLTLLVSLHAAAEPENESRINASLESSGCAYMVSVMLEESVGLKSSEARIFSLLLIHGDTQNIIEKKGFTFLDIKRAAQVMGLRAMAYRSDDLLLDLAQRKRQNKDGPYLLLKDNPEGVDRFYLYYFEDEEYVHLRDPFLGMVKVQRSEFNRMFVPYVLIIEGKTSDFTEV